MARKYTCGVRLAIRPMAVCMLFALIPASAGQKAGAKGFEGVSKSTMDPQLAKKSSEMAALLGSPEPGHLGSLSTSTGSCSDTNYGATDSYGDPCGYLTFCSGSFDDGDFTAASMCCKCGGGAQLGEGSCSNTDYGATDRYDDPCGDLTICGGSFDDKDFTADSMCCKCGGGITSCNGQLTGCTDIGLGDGDCDFDTDCRPGLECGTDNCQVWHPTWDSTLDCCQEVEAAAWTMTTSTTSTGSTSSTTSTTTTSSTSTSGTSSSTTGTTTWSTSSSAKPVPAAQSCRRLTLEELRHLARRGLYPKRAKPEECR